MQPGALAHACTGPRTLGLQLLNARAQELVCWNMHHLGREPYFPSICSIGPRSSFSLAPASQGPCILCHWYNKSRYRSPVPVLDTQFGVPKTRLISDFSILWVNMLLRFQEPCGNEAHASQGP